MSLKNECYSILLVSASEIFNNALLPLLPEAKYSPVVNVSSISVAKRTIAERNFDFVIINSPIHNDAGISFAIDVCNSKNTVVLLLVKNDLHAEIHEKVKKYGVFTLSKPTSKPIILTSLDWLESARERLRQTEKKNLSVEEKMEEIRIVNRAKWLLIKERNMEEPIAHRYIEKQAMDRCISKCEIAKEIINSYNTNT